MALTKRDYFTINVMQIWLYIFTEKYCELCVNACSFEIMEPPRPFALRLSSKLLLGITRVFARQTHYLLGKLRRFVL